MKRKIILFGCLITLIYGFKPTNFGLESISFNLNNKSIATWTLLQTKIDTIVLNNFGVMDTIKLVSWCDHGCFEGAKISIEKNKKKIIIIKSNTEFQNHLDSLKNNLLPNKNNIRPIRLENSFSFIICNNDLLNLNMNQIYSVFIQRRSDYESKPKEKELIFFLKLQ